MEQIKIADATLSEYEMFKVADNWLNEELQEKMWEHEAAGDTDCGHVMGFGSGF